MKQRNESLRKIGTIIFLVLIVIGFSVPLFLNPTDNAPAAVAEPKICRNDADCYLTCGTEAVPVLCYQNLCTQNSCSEASPFPYQNDAQSITLTVQVNQQKISLGDQGSLQDLFVRFEGDIVRFYSSRLSLGQILEKTGMSLTYPCLIISGSSYCASENHKLNLMVNKIDSYQYENYIPKEGDIVVLQYS